MHVLSVACFAAVMVLAAARNVRQERQMSGSGYADSSHGDSTMQMGGISTASVGPVTSTPMVGGQTSAYGSSSSSVSARTSTSTMASMGTSGYASSASSSVSAQTNTVPTVTMSMAPSGYGSTGAVTINPVTSAHQPGPSGGAHSTITTSTTSSSMASSAAPSGSSYYGRK
ncbi:hypothetical protein RvY_06343 [Ramazzottius varieornatus]|uniref:Uncharacterized protein n=1 Tax=Ramazzottius varieornatus TaxID=947166 RepID=A0A1D1V6Z2_RAMVA|nr:hypothetical protein RvY_06343 [Ramazzottius varieornatus]